MNCLPGPPALGGISESWRDHAATLQQLESACGVDVTKLAGPACCVQLGRMLAEDEHLVVALCWLTAHSVCSGRLEVHVLSCSYLQCAD